MKRSFEARIISDSKKWRNIAALGREDKKLNNLYQKSLSSVNCACKVIKATEESFTYIDKNGEEDGINISSCG